MPTVVDVLALGTASAAYATKPGSGSSDGRAVVFAPNPAQDLGIQGLTDQRTPRRPRGIPLGDAHRPRRIRIPAREVGDIRSETGNPAYSPANRFFYDRHQDEFEQVMAYYWITEAQRYIQSLGFGSTRPVNMRPQKLRINQWGADNSFATDKQDEIALGKAASTTRRTAR